MTQDRDIPGSDTKLDGAAVHDDQAPASGMGVVHGHELVRVDALQRGAVLHLHEQVQSVRGQAYFVAVDDAKIFDRLCPFLVVGLLKFRPVGSGNFQESFEFFFQQGIFRCPW